MPDHDSVLQELEAWRRHGTSTGRFTFIDLRKSLLQQLARARNPQEVSRLLPAQLQWLTDEVWRIVGPRAESAPPPPAPPSTPAPTPAVPPPRAPGDGLADLVLADTEFPARSATALMPIKVEPTPDGLRYRWPTVPLGPDPNASGPGFYRVVTSEAAFPLLPEDGTLVALTRESQALDAVPLTSGLRFVQVWVHTGPSAEAAGFAQPVRLAQREVVANVADVAWTVGPHQVSAEWTAPGRAEAVEVVRLPADHPDPATALDDPASLLQPELDHRHGFVDDTVVPGQSYLYAVRTRIATGPSSSVLSPLLRHALVVPVRPEPVTDLRVELRPDDLVDLRWSPPPTGHVEVYATATPPPQFLSSRQLPATELAQYLDPASRVPGAVQRGEGEHAKRGVAWAEGAERLHFTPVTVAGDAVHVGRPVPAVRVGSPTEVELVERVDTQLLKFGWPVGAAFVQVWTGPRDGDGGGAGGRRQDVSLEAYRQMGGLQLTALPDGGCRVHLVGVAIGADGQQSVGRPAWVDYRGLQRMAYRTFRVRRFGVQVVGLGVDLRSVHGPLEVRDVGFVARHHPERLPLHAEDGEPVDLVPDGEGVHNPLPYLRPQDVGRLTPQGGSRWRLTVDPARGGYVRMFVSVNPRVADQVPPVALLDPPVRELRL
ncbi:hypothetical protein DT076_13840 [Desertihabitans brevis]|uniref:Fibronectin type III domain-containing protein n=1 Tax=Desertihabitans brevis TaxID=2268447 RepID=A0A367YSX4_9ACTN|nr:hypothetical protein [Desertihabitans brevis]RCK68983.1 hypothetical protein DT076_13840 [Desertihabitans brevis]